MLMLSSDTKRSLAEAAECYARQVEGAWPYLAARGLTAEVVARRQIGFVAEPLVGHEQYVGRCVIAYQTPTGIVDLRFRSITSDEGPKYLSRPGAEQRMYGVLAFDKPSDVIAICEGEFDSIVIDELCGIPAVGIPGANGWKPYHWRAFEDYSKVLIFADGDPAGRDFAKRVATSIQSAIVIQMPDGMDANDVYLYEGAEGIRKRAGL